MDGGRAWLLAREKFMDKVMPWDPINMPSKPMPPRCALVPFQPGTAPSLMLPRSFQRQRDTHDTAPDQSMMIDAKKARSNFRALRHYTPVGMLSKILDMGTPSAHLDIFVVHMEDEIAHIVQELEANAEKLQISASSERSERDGTSLQVPGEQKLGVVSTHSTSTATSLFDRAGMRRRPMSAGTGRPTSAGARRSAPENALQTPASRKRPSSAQSVHRTSAPDRYEAVFKDPAAFQRLQTKLDRCPESTRLFKMLDRMESRGQPSRKKAVFRPSSAPPARTNSNALFGVSPYSASPAAQLLLMQQTRRPRPASANNFRPQSPALGKSKMLWSAKRTSSAMTLGKSNPVSMSAAKRLTYIPPRPASAGPKMNSQDDNTGVHDWGNRSSTSTPALLSTLNSTVAPGRQMNNSAVLGQRRRQRSADDFVRLFCAEAGKSLAEIEDDTWVVETMIWRRHPFAYTRIPKYLKEKGDLFTLADMLTDPQFITRGIICSGVEAMLSVVNSALAVMMVVEQQAKEAGNHSQYAASTRRLSRVRDFQVFLRMNAETLEKEPYKFFALGVYCQDEDEEMIKNPTPFVKHQVERCLQEASEMIDTIEMKLIGAEDVPKSSLRQFMIFHEYLEMLRVHGCMECLSQHFSVKAHHLLNTCSRYIAENAEYPDASCGLVDRSTFTLKDRVRCELLRLNCRDSPSMSESLLSMVPASPGRYLYLDLSISPTALSSTTSLEQLKVKLQEDVTSILGLDPSVFIVDRVTCDSARLTFSQDISAEVMDKSSRGLDPSYTGPITCFTSRPNEWEYVTIYVSTDQSTDPELTRLLSDMVLLEMRDLLRERYVELTIVDLVDCSSYTDNRLPHKKHTESIQACAHGDSILIIILEAQEHETTLSQSNDIVFLQPQRGMDNNTLLKKWFVDLCQVLWATFASKYSIPSDVRLSKPHSSDASAQLLEMQAMVHSFVHWPSRDEVLQKMINFVSVNLSQPVLASLAGSHGSGKSYILAKLAHSIMTIHPMVQTIYFRSANSPANRHNALLHHLYWMLTGKRDTCPNVDKIVSVLQKSVREKNVLIIVDGLDESDQDTLRACILHPAISGLGGRVRVIYCARAPLVTAGREEMPKISPAFRLQALTSGEINEYLSQLCSELHLHLGKSMKQTVLAKKQAGNPLYLRVATHHLAFFCEFRTFQRESDPRKREILSRVCQQLPGDLDYLIEDQVFTLLECQYGNELVVRVLDYLYHEEEGLSIQELAALLKFHTKQGVHVSTAAIAALCHDLKYSISSPRDTSPSGRVRVNLASARRAVARRYFDEYDLDEREKRAVISRCHMAQKCSDEVEASLLEEVVEDESDWSQEEVISCEASDDEKASQRSNTESACPSPLHAANHRSALNLGTGSNSRKSRTSNLVVSGNSTPVSTQRRKSGLRKTNSDTSQKSKVDAPVEERKYEDSINELTHGISECHQGVLCMTVAKNASGGDYICTGGAENDIKIWDFLCPSPSDDEKFTQIRGERDSNLQDLTDLFLQVEVNKHLRNYCLEPHVRAKLTGHRGSVFALATGRDMIMSGSADKSIRIWNLETFKCVGTLYGHRSVVSTLQYHEPNLYSAGHDGKIRAWNVHTQSCWASIDSTKRAAIQSILTKRDRLFVGLERRWDEKMNPIKVWGMDLGECLNELPSTEVQGLARVSKANEQALDELGKKIKDLNSQALKFSSPFKCAEIKNALDKVSEGKRGREERLRELRQRFLELKGDVYATDDVYCMGMEKCERGPREILDILFVGGNFKPILAWDIDQMMCIESMDGELHEADYTRCIAVAKGFLYSGGGKLKYQEKMASSSVADQLKLAAEHEKVTDSSGIDASREEEKCGRITVWCTSTLKPLGSITFDNVVMSMCVVQDNLFVGEVDGRISIYSRRANRATFHTQIILQIERSTRANEILAMSFEKRRGRLAAAKSLDDIGEALTANSDDPALVAALLIELGKVLSKDEEKIDAQASCSLIDKILVAMGRYRSLKRLQMHSIYLLSILADESSRIHTISNDRFKIISEVMCHEMRDFEVIQRAGCLFFLEIFAALEPELDSNSIGAIESGALLAVLTSMRSYARPGCARDTKNQADTTVLEVAVPLLRFMAVRYPDVCREIIEKVGTESLDKLEGNLLDEKQKLEKAMLLRENNLLHILIADLAIAQGAMGIKIRGRPLPTPVIKHAPRSPLFDQLFAHGSDESASTVAGVQARLKHRANREIWVEILKAGNVTSSE